MNSSEMPKFLNFNKKKKPGLHSIIMNNNKK